MIVKDGYGCINIVIVINILRAKLSLKNSSLSEQGNLTLGDHTNKSFEEAYSLGDCGLMTWCN